MNCLNSRRAPLWVSPGYIPDMHVSTPSVELDNQVTAIREPEHTFDQRPSVELDNQVTAIREPEHTFDQSLSHTKLLIIYCNQHSLETTSYAGAIAACLERRVNHGQREELQDGKIPDHARKLPFNPNLTSCPILHKDMNTYDLCISKNSNSSTEHSCHGQCLMSHVSCLMSHVMENVDNMPTECFYWHGIHESRRVRNTNTWTPQIILYCLQLWREQCKGMKGGHMSTQANTGKHRQTQANTGKQCSTSLTRWLHSSLFFFSLSLSLSHYKEMKLKARCWCESPPWSLADTCLISTSAIKHLMTVVGLVTLLARQLLV